jgi:hypothetical protein
MPRIAARWLTKNGSTATRSRSSAATRVVVDELPGEPRATLDLEIHGEKGDLRGGRRSTRSSRENSTQSKA